MAGLFWVVPFIPAASALVLFVLGAKLPRKYVAWQACGALLASFVLSLFSVFGLTSMDPARLPLFRHLFEWIRAGSLSSSFGLQFDSLSAVMALIVTGVGSLIHIYSAGYMARDRSYSRYFGLLNLFVSGMLFLVLSSNLLFMFIGWEGVGLCSYLLIGFWFEKPAAAAAGQKAFLVNRVGDAAFILGAFFLISRVGSGEFRAISQAVESGAFSQAGATLIALLLFAGATGKSAQIPLHVWLPDAMEGPTPVSALIHAATMVTAGVFMVCRLNALYSFSATASQVVGLVGAVTAVLAATMATVQNDIKKVLAYSTISQIGYMFIGCGAGAYSAAMFHLFTHAFFKSLLFLAAGSVMHALGGETDVRKMGGLKKLLPVTYRAFLVGGLAVSGIPFFSGFFSKDAILNRAYESGQTVVWSLGVLAAIMTAFYAFRLIDQVFHGEARFEEKLRGHIHESPPIMTVPLFILAVLSFAAGYAGLPAVLGKRADLFGRFLGPVLGGGQPAIFSASEEWTLILLSTIAAAAGVYLAFLFYRQNPAIPHRLVKRFPGLYRVLSQKYYFDQAYQAGIVRPLLRGSEAAYRGLDLKVIDGAIHGSASAAKGAGNWLGCLQSGLIKDYALFFLLGAAFLLGYMVFSL